MHYTSTDFLYRNRRRYRLPCLIRQQIAHLSVARISLSLPIGTARRGVLVIGPLWQQEAQSSQVSGIGVPFPGVENQDMEPELG